MVLEPGEEFVIAYRNGTKTLTAHGLSFRDMRNVGKVEDRLNEAKGSEQYDIMEEALRAALPKWTDEAFEELMPTLTLDDVAEIFAHLMGRLSADETKKSESQPVSEHPGSAKPAMANATQQPVMH